MKLAAVRAQGPAALLALGGGAAAGFGASYAARTPGLAAAAGAAFVVGALLFFSRTLHAPRTARLSAALAALLAAPLAYAYGARALASLALLAFAFLGAREGPEKPFLPFGASGLAVVATWLAPPLGMAGLVALILLQGHRVPLKGRFSAAMFPSFLGLALSIAGLMLLPERLVGASHLLRGVILVAAVVANLAIAHVLGRVRLGGSARKTLAVLVALLPTLALLAVVAVAGRLTALRGGEMLPLLTFALAALFAIGLLGFATLGLALLLATENDAKPYLLAFVVGGVFCVALGAQALAIWVFMVAISLGVATIRALPASGVVNPSHARF